MTKTPNRLRELRLARGWSQPQVASELGVDPSQVSRYETGRFDFSTDQLKILCGLFGVTVEQLLGWE